MYYGNSFNSFPSSTESEHRVGLYRGKPGYSDILEAARAAVRVFEGRGTSICAVGGLACKLFGNPRTPNDVDLLLLDTTTSQEELKRTLISKNPQFYLINARDPLATYKVLWYRTTQGVRVKVDLLQPGIMSIPNILPQRIQYKTDQGYRIPVAPFGLVLLLKLQAWAQHRDAVEYRYRTKQYTDSRDIDVLLPLAVANNTTFDYLPEDFRQEASKRVKSYTTLHPDLNQYWKRLGFETIELKTNPFRSPQGRFSSRRTERIGSTGLDNLVTSLRNVRLDDPHWHRRPRTRTYDYDDY